MPTSGRSRNYEYDFAISFADENRNIVEKLDRFIKNGELNDFEIPIGVVQENILGVDVNFGYGKIRSPKCRPIGDPKELYEKFVNLNEDKVDLSLELTDSVVILEWFYKISSLFSYKQGRVV